MYVLVKYWNGGYNGRVLGLYKTADDAEQAMPDDDYSFNTADEGYRVLRSVNGKVELGDELVRAELIEKDMEF